MVVVGPRGLGGFRDLLLGSTGTQVATHSLCPCVVVPGMPAVEVRRRASTSCRPAVRRYLRGRPKRSHGAGRGWVGRGRPASTSHP
ncbi:MAG: universal stress protein [Actinomycetales bacterium]